MTAVRTFSAAFVMKGDVGLERGRSLYLLQCTRLFYDKDTGRLHLTDMNQN